MWVLTRVDGGLLICGLEAEVAVVERLANFGVWGVGGFKLEVPEFAGFTTVEAGIQTGEG
jgi:hypothetical protein